MQHICAVLIAVLLGAVVAPRSTYRSGRVVEGASQCFPQTGKCIGDLFFEYWQANGGLAQQGYPVTDELEEVNPVDHQLYRVQYFERARFEHHPENVGTPYVVLLGLLGREQYLTKYPGGRPAGGRGETCFAVTGRCISGAFFRYWQGHGGLAQQGYPLSDEFDEVSPINGRSFRVQYFERARFELHPENAGTPHEVLLGLLGNEQFNGRYGGGRLVNVGALADVRVEEEEPDTNFGTDAHLTVDAKPIRESYLKFDVTGVTGTVSSARLRIYCAVDLENSASGFGGTVARMSDTGWSETGVTFRNRPRIDGPTLDSLGEVVQGRWYEFDVTAAVNGNGVIAFGLRSSGEDSASYSSREDGKYAPQLIVAQRR
jgi:hypothetical protein